MNDFPKWSIGVLIAAIIPTMGWVVVQLIETDRTQESVLTRLNSIESENRSFHNEMKAMQQLIAQKASDRFTGTQWDDKSLTIDQQHLRLWDAYSRVEKRVTLIEAKQ